MDEEKKLEDELKNFLSLDFEGYIQYLVTKFGYPEAYARHRAYRVFKKSQGDRIDVSQASIPKF